MKRLLLLLTLATAAWAQVPQPDCQIFFHFTASGQTSPTSPNAGLDNRTQGCTTWNVSYARSGFSAVTVVLQSAPNNAGVAGTWVTFAGGTVITGANPLTDAAESFAWITGYNPWVRVRLDAATGSGTVDGAAYGWRIPSASATGGGGVTSDVNVAQWGGATTTLGQKLMAASVPITIASNQTGLAVTSTDNLTQMASSNIYPCLSRAAITLSGSGNTQIIALSGTTTIRICHISFSTTAPEDFKITRGTGSDCATGTADVTGLYKAQMGMALDFGPFAPLTGAAAGAICLNQSAVQATGGVVLYDQR